MGETDSGSGDTRPPYAQITGLWHLLGDPARVSFLDTLFRRDGAVSVMALADSAGVTADAVPSHMEVFQELGMVRLQEGEEIAYVVNDADDMSDTMRTRVEGFETAYRVFSSRMGTETPFSSLLLPEARLRIVATMIHKFASQLTAAEIAHLAGVHRRTVYRHLPVLCTAGVLRQVDSAERNENEALVDVPANAGCYTLCLDDEGVNALGRVDACVTSSSAFDSA